jgi:hypothetical protein
MSYYGCVPCINMASTGEDPLQRRNLASTYREYKGTLNISLAGFHGPQSDAGTSESIPKQSLNKGATKEAERQEASQERPGKRRRWSIRYTGI